MLQINKKLTNSAPSIALKRDLTLKDDLFKTEKSSTLKAKMAHHLYESNQHVNCKEHHCDVERFCISIGSEFSVFTNLIFNSDQQIILFCDS